LSDPSRITYVASLRLGPEGCNVCTRFVASTLSCRITESYALTNSVGGLSRSNGQTRRQGKYRDITAEGMTIPLHASWSSKRAASEFTPPLQTTRIPHSEMLTDYKFRITVALSYYRQDISFGHNQTELLHFWKRQRKGTYCNTNLILYIFRATVRHTWFVQKVSGLTTVHEVDKAYGVLTLTVFNIVHLRSYTLRPTFLPRIQYLLPTFFSKLFSICC